MIGRKLTETFKRRRVSIASVKETIWKRNKAKEIGNGYKTFYTGKTSGRNGVGVLLDESVKTIFIDVIRKSDGIIAVKLFLKTGLEIIFGVYASQVECAKDEKNWLWHDVDEIMLEITDKEKKVGIRGDFNSHMGRENQELERVNGEVGE